MRRAVGMVASWPVVGNCPHTRAARSTPALPLVTPRRRRRRRPGVERPMAVCAHPPPADPCPGFGEVIGLVVNEHPNTCSRMRLSILGPVEASVDGRPVALGGAKQRAVLAMLGLEANRAVPADHLI